jgi:toxin CcdB
LPQQFDLLENLNPTRRGQYPFLVVLQHDRALSTGSVIVAPLFVANPALVRTRLHPSIEIHGRRYVLLVEELAAVPRHMLGHVVGSAESHRYDIIAALDLLFTGI